MNLYILDCIHHKFRKQNYFLVKVKILGHRNHLDNKNIHTLSFFHKLLYKISVIMRCFKGWIKKQECTLLISAQRAESAQSVQLHDQSHHSSLFSDFTAAIDLFIFYQWRNLNGFWGTP